MRKLILALCVTGSLWACSAPTAPDPLPSTPVPSSPPTPPTPPGASSARVIAVGEPISETLIGHGASRLYDVTPGAQGTLRLRITWTDRGLIEVWLDDRPIAQDHSGRIDIDVPVRAGQRYRLWVGDGAPWDYGDWVLTYQMTTWLDE